MVVFFTHMLLPCVLFADVLPWYISAGNDGGVAKAFPGGNIQTLTLDCLVQQQPVAFLKIDVEGNDLKAIGSAHQAYSARLVRNVLVEFGPPQRWAEVARQTAEDGVRLMQTMEGYGFTTWLAPSQCSQMANAQLHTHLSTAHGVRVARISPHQFRALVELMRRTSLECYMWWSLDSVG